MGKLKNYLTCDLHFNSVLDLTHCFSNLTEYLKNCPDNDELQLKVHWKKELLTKEYQQVFTTEIQKITEQYQSLNLTYSWPHCLVSEDTTSPFPDCQDCQHFKNQVCGWPYQMRSDYYVREQREFQPTDFDSLTEEDFSSSRPITWINPAKSEIEFISSSLANSELVVDYGCGNGFLDYLFLSENKNLKILGFDPLFSKPLKHERFEFFDAWPKEEINTNPYSLISSQADYNLPFNDVLKENPPQKIIFIALTDIFGNPGSKTTADVTSKGVTKIRSKKIFGFDDLIRIGYKKTHESKMNSYHNENVSLLMYEL